MKKLLPISVFLLSALAVSATPVLFSSQSLTGSVNNRSILVQPDRVQNPLVLGTNLVPVFDFSVQPVGGQVITNLLPWGYTITVSGWPRSAHIIVPDSTNTINVATLINTNAFAPLNIYLTGSSGGGLPVTNNGVTWFYDSLGGLRWTNTANGANGLLGYDGHVKFTDQFGNVIKSDTNGLAVNGNYVLTAIPTTYALKSDVTNITAAFMSGLTNLTMPFYLTGQDTDGGATSPGRLKFYEGTIFGQPESFGMRADPNFDLDFITSAAGTIFFYYADTTNLMLHLGPAGAIFNETVTAPNYATSQGAFIASDSSVELFDSIYGGDVFRWLVGGNDFAMFGTNGSYIRILPNPVINGFIITNMVGRIVNANLPVGNAPGTFTNTAPIQAAQVVGVVTNAQFAQKATNAPDGNVSASLNNATNIANSVTTVPAQASAIVLAGGGVTTNLWPTVYHTNGTATYYTNSGTDASRGDSLYLACSNMLAGETISVPSGNFLMHTIGINLANNATYNFNNSYLYIDSTSTNTASPTSIYAYTLFYAPLNTSFGWKIIGTATFDGRKIAGAGSFLSGGGMCCILNQNAPNTLVQNITMQNWTGGGFMTLNGPSVQGQTETVCNSVSALTNNIGFYVSGEYGKFIGCISSFNTNGFKIFGGNNVFEGCSASANVTGVELLYKQNGGHGSWIGGDMNHCGTSLLVDTNFNVGVVAGGFSFIGAHAYVGTMSLGGCGISWIGGDITSTIQATSAGAFSGKNYFDGVCFPNGVTNTLNLSASDRTNIVLTRCFDLTNIYPSDVILATTLTMLGGSISPGVSLPPSISLNALNFALADTNIYSSFAVFPTTATRNDFTSSLGYEFGVNNTITVTNIGRLYVAGNSQNHPAELWDMTGGFLMASNTILNSSASDANGYKYAALTATNLIPGRLYAITINETSGGDTWRDVAAASFSNPIYYYGYAFGASGAPPNNLGSNGLIFDAPVIQYTITSGLTVNGFGSYATNTFTMGSTGFTNKSSLNLQVFEMTGTSVVYTNPASGYGFSFGSPSVLGVTFVLKPNCFIKGTAMAAAGIEAQ